MLKLYFYFFLMVLKFHTFEKVIKKKALGVRKTNNISNSFLAILRHHQEFLRKLPKLVNMDARQNSRF